MLCIIFGAVFGELKEGSSPSEISGEEWRQVLQQETFQLLTVGGDETMKKGERWRKKASFCGFPTIPRGEKLTRGEIRSRHSGARIALGKKEVPRARKKQTNRC